MSNRYLLDTNILVHLVRGDAAGKHIQRTYNLKAYYAECIISIVTHGEMEKLGRAFGWNNDKLQAMRHLLDQLVTIDIHHPEIISCYADIDCFSDQNGISMGKNDVWIAATAKATAYTLMTMDQDFDHLTPTFIERIYIPPVTTT